MYSLGVDLRDWLIGERDLSQLGVNVGVVYFSFDLRRIEFCISIDFFHAQFLS